MKLLFDQNLSHRLTNLLSDLFPGSAHVKELGMDTASDTEIWEIAKSEGFTIISKDSDFHQRSFVWGPPPKVIWIQKGNCSTDEIHEIIRNHISEIEDFIVKEGSAFLILE